MLFAEKEELIEKFRREARERMATEGKRGGKLAGKGRPGKIGVASRDATPESNGTPQNGKTAAKLAEQVGVSPRTMERGMKIVRKGTPADVRS